jgi:hypothetical protein
MASLQAASTRSTGELKLAKYLFVYHGGGKPESEEEGQQAMEAWGQWFGSMGSSVVDGGNPVGQSTTVNSDGSVADDGGPNPTTGYGVFAASSLEEAIEMAKGCPILADGGSVELAEMFEP